MIGTTRSTVLRVPHCKAGFSAQPYKRGGRAWVRDTVGTAEAEALARTLITTATCKQQVYAALNVCYDGGFDAPEGIVQQAEQRMVILGGGKCTN